MDELIKAVDRDRQVRLVITRTTELTGELARRHQMSATVSAASGRLVSGALLIASDLKAGNGVTIQVNGGGPAGDIVAVAHPEGTARLYVENPQADLPSIKPGKLDVGGVVGKNGHLRVIKDLGLKQPFVGSVPLQSGELADDMAYYLLTSEQIPSLVALGVLVDTDLSVMAAGGLLLQALPGADDEKLARIEERIHQSGALSSLLKKYEQLEDIIALVMGEDGYQVLERMPVAFKCRCSREKIEDIIKSLPQEDIDKSLEEMGEIEVKCNFCNEMFIFSEQDVSNLRGPQPNSNQP